MNLVNTISLLNVILELCHVFACVFTRGGLVCFPWKSELRNKTCSQECAITWEYGSIGLIIPAAPSDYFVPWTKRDIQGLGNQCLVLGPLSGQGEK